MDHSIRIGVGASAMAIVTGIAQPWITWWIAAPLIVIFLIIAVWGFWPVHSLISRRKGTAEGAPAAKLVDAKSIEIAGLVNALMEAALSWTFKLPLPVGDIWLARYEELRDSAHPIWSDREANQLRREFLHYCGIVGDPTLGDMHERANDRKELAQHARNLMAKLKGEQ